MLYLSIKYYNLISNEMKPRNTSFSQLASSRSSDVKKPRNFKSCIYIFSIGTMFILYTFRIIMRDVVIPISEWPKLYKDFNDWEPFLEIINAQAFLFDFLDFLIAMLSAFFFYRSARDTLATTEKKKGKDDTLFKDSVDTTEILIDHDTS